MMKMNRKTLGILVLLGVLLIGKGSLAETIQDYDITSIPIASFLSEISNKVDIAKNKYYPYIWDLKRQLVWADPFYFERKRGEVPKYTYRQFVTDKHPREVYLFYIKNFYNLAGGSKSVSRFNYDPKNEGDEVSPYAQEGDVYYTLEISSGVPADKEGKMFAITAFRVNSAQKTTVYIFEYMKR